LTTVRRFAFFFAVFFRVGFGIIAPSFVVAFGFIIITACGLHAHILAEL
jgi:hypothetical protein